MPSKLKKKIKRLKVYKDMEKKAGENGLSYADYVKKQVVKTSWMK